MINSHRKLIFFIGSLLLVLSLFCAFLHHHEDGQSQDCFVCKFVRQIVSFFVFLAAALFTLASQNFPIPASERLTRLSLASKLRNRAPPFLLQS